MASGGGATELNVMQAQVYGLLLTDGVRPVQSKEMWPAASGLDGGYTTCIQLNYGQEADPAWQQCRSRSRQGVA